MMNNMRLKKGGIDTIVAYIVVSIPLIYLLIFTIGIIYHFSIQSYVSQVAKELAISAGTYGKLSPAMINRASDRLTNLDVGDFEIAIKVQKYDEVSNSFSADTYGYRAVTSAPTSLGLKKKDIIEIYLQSTEKSMLATIANFGMFGGAGTESDLRYTAFREEIVRNDPS